MKKFYIKNSLMVLVIALGSAAFSPVLGADEKDDRFVLKEKESPDACGSMPVDKEECGRWYAASASRILVIRNINFEFGKSTLPTSERSLLRKYLVLMKENPKLRLRVVGHSDSIGSEEFNRSLSLARAGAVVKFFEENGVSARRLMIEGKGESEPVVSNKTGEGRWKNRRVEMRFLKKPARYGQNVRVIYGR